jgi:hypothetical protein
MRALSLCYAEYDDYPCVTPALLCVFQQLSFKFIVRAVRKAGIADLYGMANTQNSSGDDVKKVGESVSSSQAECARVALLLLREYGPQDDNRRHPTLGRPANHGQLQCLTFVASLPPNYPP